MNTQHTPIPDSGACGDEVVGNYSLCSELRHHPQTGRPLPVTGTIQRYNTPSQSGAINGKKACMFNNALCKDGLQAVGQRQVKTIVYRARQSSTRSVEGALNRKISQRDSRARAMCNRLAETATTNCN